MLSRRLKIFKNEHLTFYSFISPWLVGFLVFTLGPMLFSLYAAFTDWDGITAPVFKGISNFKYMFLQDDLFWKSILNTMYFSFVSVPLNLFIALLLATLINRKMFGSYFFRSVFYMPSIVAGVAVFLTWQNLFNPLTGVFNAVLQSFNLNGIGWISDASWAMPSIILMSVTTCGGPMLILLAGLQDIPEDYYESARIDGANNFVLFWKITFPLLTPILFFNLIMNIIGSLQIFAQPWIMTQGGPRYSTYVYGIHLYNNAFRYYKFGYACALAWVLFVLIALFSTIVFKSSKLWVQYTQDVD